MGMKDRQCFTDIHQLLSLLLSGSIVDILDDEVRNARYPLVAIPVGFVDWIEYRFWSVCWSESRK